MGELQINNHKSLYLCSFYRPPDGNSSAISELNNCLVNLCAINPTNPPHMLLAGDFNLPDISWSDGNGRINPSPTYGTEVNQLLLDSVNDNGLEQLVSVPTRGKNILDLLFCSHPYLIADVEIIPGISDHEAVFYCLNLSSKPLTNEVEHPIFLYHKGDMNSLKSDMLDFQMKFITSDPYSNSVEENWQNFKNAISSAISTHVPQRSSNITSNLPWLTHHIKKQMNLRTRLYKRAKHLQTKEAWSNYHLIRNEITNSIRDAHTKYQNKLFTSDGEINQKKFWKYIKNIRKDQHGVAPLNVNGTLINNSKDKAEALNYQFQSVFTQEDLLHLPSCGDPLYSSMSNISISVDGVLNLLKTLDTKKASGPDGIPARILKLCAEEIAPILTVIFVQSLDSGHIPKDWLSANITPVFKKGDRSKPNNYRPISLTSICCKLLEHILYHHIIDHLNTNSILIDQQFGFRSGHSCEAQLISVVEDIHLAMEQCHQVDVIFIDFQKAFDKVPHH